MLEPTAPACEPVLEAAPGVVLCELWLLMSEELLLLEGEVLEEAAPGVVEDCD